MGIPSQPGGAWVFIDRFTALPKWSPYLVSAGIVAVAALLRIWPLGSLGSTSAWLTFYPAVVVAAVIGGFACGLFALCLTCVFVVFGWPLLVDAPFITDRAHWLATVVFILDATLISVVAEGMRRANARARVSLERNYALAQQLQSDLDSAAHYMHSVLPGDLEGTVLASSRYLPSRTVGGDAFDYRWLDDDHLLIKMLDVSGHGIEPALLSVSIHNLLRSGTLSPDVLRSPQRVLAELNRLFPMEGHRGHYFTIWYGVYQPSTRTLVYTSAGHPPALLFTNGHLTELHTTSPPVGMFTDTGFTTATCQVPPDSELLLYSDGAFDLELPGGGQWSLPQFITLCAESAQSPDWSLNTLIDKLRATSATGDFDDDCSVIRLQFD